MIDPIFQRAELMLGEEAMKKLSQVRVIVFGVGGSRVLVCGRIGENGSRTSHHR